MNKLPKYSITYSARGGTIICPIGYGNVTFSTPLVEYERIDTVVEKMTDFPEVINLINKLYPK